MNFVFATATQLAQIIRDKKVSSVEVVYAYLQQIDLASVISSNLHLANNKILRSK